MENEYFRASEPPNIHFFLKPFTSFRLDGGQLVVFETRQEWACIEHWVETAYQPSYQRYAISMKKSNFGDYRWFYADGSDIFPDFCNLASRYNDNVM